MKHSITFEDVQYFREFRVKAGTPVSLHINGLVFEERIMLADSSIGIVEIRK